MPKPYIFYREGSWYACSHKVDRLSAFFVKDKDFIISRGSSPKEALERLQLERLVINKAYSENIYLAYLGKFLHK